MLNPGGILVTPFGDRLVKVVKDQEGKIEMTTLVSVRYSDLTLPSDAEIKAARKAVEIAKAKRILIPESQLKFQFSNLLNNSQFSDIKIISKGRELCAHSLILAIRSEYFRNIFAQQSVPRDINLDPYDYDIIFECLKFMYTDFCSLPSDTTKRNSILELAKLLQLYGLVKKIEDDIEPSERLEDVLSKLINNKFFSDVTIVLDDAKIPAHRLLLEVRSEYFRMMFGSGLRESQTKEIRVPDCSLDVFLEVLHFIYTDKCTLNEQNCITVLEQANFFQLPRLTAMCEKFWFHNISIPTSPLVLSVADRFNATQLKHFSMEFIFDNIEEVVKTPGWKELDRDLVTWLLISSIKRSK
jgi:hypothetical protein